MLEIEDVVAWAGSMWFRIGIREGCCENGNEIPSNVVAERLPPWNLLM
jgi:hypothetical protein